MWMIFIKGKWKGRSPYDGQGPIADIIFKSHRFLGHVSMHTIDTSLKLKLPGIGSSTLSILISKKLNFRTVLVKIGLQICTSSHVG
jgi:hypothetical protein